MGSLKRAILFLAIIFSAGTAFTQPVLTSKNMAMGGGGTAYLTGFEANFINPANAMIRTRTTSFTLGFGEGGYLFNPFLPVGSISDHFSRFRNFFKPFEPNSEPLTSSERAEILLRNFNNDRLFSEHQQRYDFILAGLKWQRDNKTFTLSARSRVATRVEVGRGWYDEVFVETNSKSVRDVSLVQQSQYLYEFSFGYAQRLEFIDGLIPRLGELYIGIAPKFIIGGEYLDLNYNARYELQQGASIPRLIQSFQFSSTGSYSEAVENYRFSEDPGTAVNRNLETSLFPNPTGYGAGLDFGLTYVLALGDDLSLAARDGKQLLQKSLRLALSVTDIGLVSYTKNPLTISSPTDTSQSRPTATADDTFEGRIGQHIYFFDGADDIHNVLQNSVESDRDSFLALLPASVNAGVLLETNRIKLASDLTLGINDTAFNNTKLVGHFGLEVRPVKAIPIRLGSRLAVGDPAFWSLGTGIEMKHWELSVAGRFSARSVSGIPEFAGAIFGGLSFFF